MILGVTGGVASGKTSVSKIFRKLGIEVVDADIIAREVLEEEAVKNELVHIFGENVLNENKDINRRKIREAVFNDKALLKKLNNLVHPLVGKIFEKIKAEINKYETNKKKLVIFDIPLLFEAKLEYLCDKILVVTTDYDIKIKRLVERDKISKELAEKMIEAQMSDDEKIKRADIVVTNNGTLEDLEREINKIYLSLI